MAAGDDNEDRPEDLTVSVGPDRAGPGGPGLLPRLAGAPLIIVPPMTAGFSYRCVLAAVAVTCLFAGLAFAVRSARGAR